MATEHSWDDLLELDRIIHEPARLAIMAILTAAASADFVYLQRATGLTRGNLSAHLARLEEAGYLTIAKTFEGKLPRTVCQLTAQGQAAFNTYVKHMKATLARLD